MFREKVKEEAMRGDAITKGAAVWLGVLALAGSLMGCEPPNYGGSGSGWVGDGRLAVSWTLNGVPLTSESCQKERISSMNLLILSDYDGTQNIEFLNVTCGLDRFSAAMTPTGPVRILIDAMSDLGSGRMCRRYSGQATTYATTQFPAMPVPVPLRAVSGCP
jgi:hypothetical protein